MPGPKSYAKLTGDIHPPELEEGLHDLPDEQPGGTAADSGARGASASDAGRPGRDENAAGFVKDKDLGGGTDR